MSVKVEVRGLREAVQNMKRLAGVAQLELSRSAMFDAALVIAKNVRAATYTTFIRRTGFIKSGFSVRVARNVIDDEVLGFIVQREQNIAGASAEAKTVRKRNTPKVSRRAQPIFSAAFYWLFLERGTQNRRQSRTPDFLRKGRSASTKRQLSSLARYTAAASSGNIKPRPWVAPATAGSAEAAIHEFEQSFRTRVETEVSNLKK